jgi:hypothetical protein
MVSVTNALPGWAAGTVGISQLSQVGFNNSVLNGVYYAGVFLLGVNSGSVIEGGFGVSLQATAPSPNLYVDISQTALVPVGSESILFKAQPGSGSLLVTLGGQSIPIIAQSTGSNYTLYGGDISAFAGQTLSLRFTAFQSSPVNSWVLDSIQFSPSPVPEPTAVALVGVGAAALMIARCRRSLGIQQSGAVFTGCAYSGC